MFHLSKLALTNLKEVAFVVGGCNLGGFAITAVLETHKITDLVGVGSFIAAVGTLTYRNGLLNNLGSTVSSALSDKNRVQSILTLLGNSLQFRQLLVNFSVAVWGSRLATYLFSRVLAVGEDKRLNKFFKKPGEFNLDINNSFYPVRLGVFWTIQSLWGIICLTPVTLLNSIIPADNFNILNRFKLNNNLLFTGLSVIPLIGIFTGIFIETIADYQKTSYR